jgi:hypothetical protein
MEDRGLLGAELGGGFNVDDLGLPVRVVSVTIILGGDRGVAGKRQWLNAEVIRRS